MTVAIVRLVELSPERYWWGAKWGGGGGGGLYLHRHHHTDFLPWANRVNHFNGSLLWRAKSWKSVSTNYNFPRDRGTDVDLNPRPSSYQANATLLTKSAHNSSKYVYLNTRQAMTYQTNNAFSSKLSVCLINSWTAAKMFSFTC